MAATVQPDKPVDYKDVVLEVGVEGDLFHLHIRRASCVEQGCVQATEELARKVMKNV